MKITSKIAITVHAPIGIREIRLTKAEAKYWVAYWRSLGYLVVTKD